MGHVTLWRNFAKAEILLSLGCFFFIKETLWECLIPPSTDVTKRLIVVYLVLCVFASNEKFAQSKGHPQAVRNNQTHLFEWSPGCSRD